MSFPKRKNKKCLVCGHIFRRYKRETTFDAQNPWRQVCPKCETPKSYNRIVPWTLKQERELKRDDI